MCGIIGYTGNQNAVDVLINGLKTLEYRGYDSAGIAYSINDNVKIIKASGKIVNLEEKLANIKDISHCGIGHTRWATHGEPSDNNSHPHNSEKCTIVHNGIIENYMEIKNKLTNHGYTFYSQTDTEVVAKLIDFCYNNNPIETIKIVCEQIRGSFAFGIIFNDLPDLIFATRRECPLIVANGNKENFITSDISAVLNYTNEYFILEENEIASISNSDIKIVDFNNNVIKKEIIIANWDLETAEKEGFEHFMLKEIFEQPAAIIRTINTRIKNDLPSFLDDNIDDSFLSYIKNIHIVACGTAMHAGLIGKGLIEKFAKIPVNVDVASEFRYRQPILSNQDLVIVVSQSGETADTIAALKLANSSGCKTLAIVNVIGSTISRQSQKVIYTFAGKEISVASTKAYTVQLSIFYMLAIKLGLLTKSICQNTAKSLVNKLLDTSSLIETIIIQKNKIEQLAPLFQNSQSVFYIGRNLDSFLAQEGSLKLKEISYIHSESYPAGELKHGTISLIENDTIVIALATQSFLIEKMISNVKEVKSRGAKTILIAKQNELVGTDICDYLIEIPYVDDDFTPILTAVVSQLLAYYVAKDRGCDIDKPRNLAKSVTVE